MGEQDESRNQPGMGAGWRTWAVGRACQEIRCARFGLDHPIEFFFLLMHQKFHVYGSTFWNSMTSTESNMMEKKRLAMIERSKLRAQNLKKRPIKPPSKSDEFRSKLKMLEVALSNSNKSDFDLKNAQDLYDSLRSHFNNFLNSFPKSDLYLFRNKLHKVEC